MNYEQKYLKYKTKYFKLKNILGGRAIDLCTIIDSIEFSLIAKDLSSERHVVLISSTKDNNINYFLVYKSNSEVGIWRFYSITSSHSFQIHKGDDYITETFIHVDLQKFINQNFHLIPIFENNEKKNNFSAISLYLYSIQNDSKSTIFILENSKIVESDKIKYFINKFNTTFKDIAYRVILNFVPISYKNFKDNLISDCLRDRFKKYDYLKIINVIKCGIENVNRYPIIEQIYAIADIDKNIIMKKTIETIVPEIIIKPTVKPTNSIMKYYQIINLYLKNIGLTFDKKTIKFLYTIKLKFPNDDLEEVESTFTLNVYSIEIKINEDIFLLYFIKYRFTRKDKDATATGIYNAILNMVPITNKITVCGLNSEILSMGFYICKFVEYTSQSAVDWTNFEDYKKRYLNRIYVFVGDYVNNMYPISEFYTELPEIVEAEDKVNTEEKYIPDKTIKNLDEETDNNIKNYGIYFIEPYAELPEKFKDIKIDFTDEKFTDIIVKISEELLYEKTENISILKSYIKVPFEYTKNELLLWMNYYLKFSIEKFNTLFIRFNLPSDIRKLFDLI